MCRDSKGKEWNDYASLIDLITSTVVPTRWDSVGGPGSIAPANFGTAKTLVILQTDDVHREIAALLKEIREIAKKTPTPVCCAATRRVRAR